MISTPAIDLNNVDTTRIRLCQLDEFLDGLCGDGRVDRKHQRRESNPYDGLDVPQRVEGQLGVEARVDHMVGCDHDQRIAVRLRLDHALRSDDAIGSRKVLYDNRLAPLLGQLLRNKARQRIGRTSCRKRNHDSHRPVGISLCERGHRKCGNQEPGNGMTHPLHCCSFEH